MDLIENLTSADSLAQNPFYNKGLEIHIGHNLTAAEIKSVFSESTSGGGIPGSNHYEFGKNYIGSEMRFSVNIKLIDFSTQAKFKFTRIPSNN